MRLGMWTAAFVAGAILSSGLPQARAQHHYDQHTDVTRHNGHLDLQQHNVHHDDGHYVQPQYYPQTYVQPYIYPQQVQAPAVQYVQPQPAQAQPVQTQYVQPVQAQPAANQVPRVRTASNQVPYRGQGVTILNPVETGGTVNYVLDDVHPYPMAPGNSQKLSSKGSWVISFNRGEGYGEAKHTLTEGTYEFAVGDQGWFIRRKSDTLQSAAAPPPPPPTESPVVNEVPRLRTASQIGQ